MATGPLPDVPNALQIKFSGSVGSQPFAHILHAVHDASTPNATDLQTLANRLNAWWSTNIKVLQGTVTALSLVQVTDLGSRTGATATNGTVQTGTLAGVALPNSAAYAVGWTVGRRYRGGHPRTYHTGLITTQISNSSQVSSAFRTSMLTAWGSLLTYLSGLSLASAPNLKLCQVSYYHGKNTDGTPALRGTPIVDVITAVHGDLRIDSQRHRLGRPV